MKINLGDLKLLVIKNKKIILYAVIFICIVVVALYFSKTRQKKTETSLNSNLPAESSPVSQPASETPAVQSGNKASPQQVQKTTLSYSELVNLYEGQGRRIQFDENCQVRPSYVTYKNGTEVMFDSRSSKKITVFLSDEAYYFEPYAYKILPLSAKNPPYTVIIDCGTGKNNGRILLQP